MGARGRSIHIGKPRNCHCLGDAMSERIELRNIRTDGGTQPRAGLDEVTVEEYTQAIADGAKFPPITLFYDGQHYWLADGFHRVAAHKHAQKQRIDAEVKSGDLRDAILYSVGANATHGLRRSNDDKRRAVQRLLDDPEWNQWSDREIARKCKVSQPFVSKMRGDTDNVISMERKFTHHKTGATAVMDTSNIGKDKLVTAVTEYLMSYYKTNDAALLASHARYIARSRGNMTFVFTYLHQNGHGNHSEEAVKAALIESAQQFQSLVPTIKKSDEIGGDLQGLAQAAKLLVVIKSVGDNGRSQIQEVANKSAHMGIFQDSRQFWRTLEEILCDSSLN